MYIVFGIDYAIRKYWSLFSLVEIKILNDKDLGHVSRGKYDITFILLWCLLASAGKAGA